MNGHVEKEARWALSDEELDRIDELSSKDELMGTWTDVDGDGCLIGDTHQVVILRDGTVTDRNWDGTRGVSDAARRALSDEDTLYHLKNGNTADNDEFEETSRWMNVIVDENGDFLRSVEPSIKAPGS